MQLDTSIIVALITGACAVMGNWLVSKANRAKDEQQRAIKEAKNDMRLESIEHKLDIHNGYAEKFAEVAVMLAEIRTELNAIKEGLIK
jgi:hypothetical protein